MLLGNAQKVAVVNIVKLNRFIIPIKTFWVYKFIARLQYLVLNNLKANL